MTYIHKRKASVHIIMQVRVTLYKKTKRWSLAFISFNFYKTRNLIFTYADLHNTQSYSHVESVSTTSNTKLRKQLSCLVNQYHTMCNCIVVVIFVSKFVS